MAVAPPQNIEAEEAVIGSLLIAPRYIPKIAARLKANDFYRDTHRQLFETIVVMHVAGKTIDMLTVSDQLKGKVDKLEIHRIFSTTPAAANVAAYAEMVAQASAQREWRSLGQRLQDGEVENIERSIEQIRAKTQPPALTVPLTDALAEVDQYSQEGNELPPGISYPWGKLNYLSGGGLRKGWLCYVGADTSMGKSALAFEYADHAARQGNKVLINSLEMSPLEIGVRMAQRKGLDSRRFFRGEPNDNDRLAARICIEGSPEYANIEICRMADMNRLISTVDLVKPDLLIVDYIQLMDITDQKREEGTRRNSNALKNLAGDRQVAVFCLSQFKRGDINRVPTKFDLKDSGAQEQDADQVILIYRPLDENRLAKPEGVLYLAKTRMGKIGMEDFTFDEVSQTFTCTETRYEQYRDITEAKTAR